jgi:hypothetical protein
MFGVAFLIVMLGVSFLIVMLRVVMFGVAFYCYNAVAMLSLMSYCKLRVIKLVEAAC